MMFHCCLLPSESQAIRAGGGIAAVANCTHHPSVLLSASIAKHSTRQNLFHLAPTSRAGWMLELHTSQRQTTYSAAWVVGSSGLWKFRFPYWNTALQCIAFQEEFIFPGIYISSMLFHSLQEISQTSFGVSNLSTKALARKHLCMKCYARRFWIIPSGFSWWYFVTTVKAAILKKCPDAQDCISHMFPLLWCPSKPPV